MDIDEWFYRTSLFLRMTLGIVFIYLGFSRLFRGFVPPLDVITFLPQETLVSIFGIAEITIGLLLFIGLITRVASFFGCALLAFIIIVSLLSGVFDKYFIIKDLMMLVVCINFVVHGAARYALDDVINNI